jgi:putative addiction module component (TIGR02574 family)
MTREAMDVLQNALRLSPFDRALLIDELYRSFDSTKKSPTEAAWISEAESRVNAYESGKLPADDAKAFLARTAKQ